METFDCYICAKHQRGDAAQGGVIFADDLVYVGHIHVVPRYPRTPPEYWGAGTCQSVQNCAV